jgi:hypothetical protein
MNALRRRAPGPWAPAPVTLPPRSIGRSGWKEGYVVDCERDSFESIPMRARRPAHRPKGMNRPLVAASSGSTTLRAPRWMPP